MRDEKTKLTEAQRHALTFAASAPAKEWAGIHPRRGQHQMFTNLVARGLLADMGDGVDVDNHEHQVTLYAITDAGRAVVDETRTPPSPDKRHR